MHFAKEHEDPDDALKLLNNMKLVNEHDKFVEYIRHVESKLNWITRFGANYLSSPWICDSYYWPNFGSFLDSKRLKYRSQIEEMHALANAGQQTNSRYVDLTYIVAENEEEEEQRDYSRVSKSTKPMLNHSSYSCIGSATC